MSGLTLGSARPSAAVARSDAGTVSPEHLGGERPDALIVAGDGLFNARRGQLVNLMSRHALPAGYADPYSYPMKPVVLPPGRARLWTSPPPTGSMTPAKTIGTLRFACCNAATFGLPPARITSGESASSSAADLLTNSGLTAVPNRESTGHCDLR